MGGWKVAVLAGTEESEFEGSSEVGTAVGGIVLGVTSGGLL